MRLDGSLHSVLQSADLLPGTQIGVELEPPALIRLQLVAPHMTRVDRTMCLRFQIHSQGMPAVWAGIVVSVPRNFLLLSPPARFLGTTLADSGCIWMQPLMSGHFRIRGIVMVGLTELQPRVSG